MSILDTYKKRLKASQNYSTAHWNRSIDNYKHYLGRLDTGGTTEENYPFYSKTSVSISYEIVETVMPRIIGKDPEFTAVAFEPNDVPFEPTAKNSIDFGYNNPKLELMGEPIYLKLQRFVKEMLITGNAVGRPFWRRQTTKQMQYLANFERAGIVNSQDISMVYKTAKEMGKQNEITYSKKLIESPFLDDFDLRHVPFFLFFGDIPMIETGRMRYKIERDYVTFEELADEAERFGYDKATMDTIAEMVTSNKSGFTPEISKDFLQEYNDLFQTFDYETFKTDDDKIPLLVVDKMWVGHKVHVFVNEKYNLTGEEGMTNPYDIMKDPFLFGHDVTIPHTYFSYGEIDAIKKIEDSSNDLMNMRFDNLLQSMLNFWFVNPDLIDSTDEFVPIPGSITSVQDVDRAARLISGKDVTASAYKESDSFYAIAKRISGQEDYVKGEEGQSLAGRTYGGMRLVQEAANARFIVKSRLFEKLTLKSLGYFILEFSKQFINKDRVKRQFGEFDEVAEKNIAAAELKQIKGMFDIKVIPNSAMVIDQQAEAIKMNALADRFSSGKGPFANIPEDVNDRFLLKYLPLYGVNDAVFWVRLIREARAKRLKEEKAKPPVTATPPAAPVLPPAPPMVPPPPTGGEVLQSDQVAAQPDILASIMNGAALPPPTVPPQV